jgi:hypothetical protein
MMKRTVVDVAEKRKPSNEEKPFSAKALASLELDERRLELVALAARQWWRAVTVEELAEKARAMSTGELEVVIAQMSDLASLIAQAQAKPIGNQRTKVIAEQVTITERRWAVARELAARRDVKEAARGARREDEARREARHAAARRDKELLRRCLEALEWCGGSPDFGSGGQARAGWESVVAPLLADLGGRLGPREK